MNNSTTDEERVILNAHAETNFQEKKKKSDPRTNSIFSINIDSLSKLWLIFVLNCTAIAW